MFLCDVEDHFSVGPFVLVFLEPMEAAFGAEPHHSLFWFDFYEFLDRIMRSGVMDGEFVICLFAGSCEVGAAPPFLHFCDALEDVFRGFGELDGGREAGSFEDEVVEQVFGDEVADLGEAVSFVFLDRAVVGEGDEGLVVFGGEFECHFCAGPREVICFPYAVGDQVGDFLFGDEFDDLIF